MAELSRSLEVGQIQTQTVIEQVADKLLNMQLLFYPLDPEYKNKVILFRETSELEKITFGHKLTNEVHISNYPVHVVLEPTLIDMLNIIQTGDRQALLKKLEIFAKKTSSLSSFNPSFNRILYNFFTGIKVYLTYSPFGNCQTLSVGNFDSFATNCNYFGLNPLEILSKITKYKSQVLVDILTESEGQRELEEALTNPKNVYFDVVIKTPYKNNTGHTMCMYLLKHKEKRINAFRLIYGLHTY